MRPLQSPSFKNISFMSLIVMLTLITFSLFNRELETTDTQTQLKGLCEKDSACENAVAKHFPTCYKSNLVPSTRQNAAGLNEPEFVKCFNKASGKEYLAVQ